MLKVTNNCAQYERKAFTAKFNGVVHRFPYGITVHVSEEAAAHIFAVGKYLDEEARRKAIMTVGLRHGWTGTMQGVTPVEQVISEFKFERVKQDSSIEYATDVSDREPEDGEEHDPHVSGEGEGLGAAAPIPSAGAGARGHRQSL